MSNQSIFLAYALGDFSEFYKNHIKFNDIHIYA